MRKGGESVDALLALDGGVLLWIQDILRQDWLTPIVAFFTHLGDHGLLWIALCLLLLCFKKTRRAGVAGAIALILSLIFTNGILKNLVGRTRPWLDVAGLTALVHEPDPNSFPSGHTSAAFAAAIAWWQTMPKRWMGAAALAAAALMGMSRLYVGVHYPTDVLCGVLVGCFCGFLAGLVMRKLLGLGEKEERGQCLPEDKKNLM